MEIDWRSSNGSNLAPTPLCRAAEEQKRINGLVCFGYTQVTHSVGYQGTEPATWPFTIRVYLNSCAPISSQRDFSLRRIHPLTEIDHPMPDTYSQIYIQIVFAVSGRQNLIRKQHKEELHKYISGIVSQRRQKLLAIHCMPDHTHMLIGLKPSMALSDLVRDVKNSSTNFINTKRWVIGRFGWQDGFGAFSYGHSQLTTILNYIRNQERHHARRTFREEYLQFLKKYEIEHDERYTFASIE